MFGFFHLGLPGLVLMAAALAHFLYRRPEGYWLWVIIFLGPIGSLVYLAVEALPELRDPGAFKFAGRNRRARELEAAVGQNPSAGNYEELGQLYLDRGQWTRARQSFDAAIRQRSDSLDPFYRRAIAAVALGDFTAAVADLERVVGSQSDYDIRRAAGLLAWSYARTGVDDKAETLFRYALSASTLTETQFHFAEFLAARGRAAEARELAQRILRKRAAMPGFQRRHERPWFRQTRTLLARLPR
jgi:hypothetical protein